MKYDAWYSQETIDNGFYGSKEFNLGISDMVLVCFMHFLFLR